MDDLRNARPFVPLNVTVSPETLYKFAAAINQICNDMMSPLIVDDARALANSIFYSTDTSKLCYKDPDGVVHELY